LYKAKAFDLFSIFFARPHCLQVLQVDYPMEGFRLSGRPSPKPMMHIAYSPQFPKNI